MAPSPRLTTRTASRHAALTGSLVVLLLAGAVAGCGSGSDPGNGVPVVATTTQIGDFVREVGGRAVSVDQILQPNTDPHAYEPRPSDVTDAAGARIVFSSGDNLDSWVGEVVDESGSAAETVDLGAAVPDRRPGESSGAEASEFDPHWWHDPLNAEAAVREIADSLSEADPAHAALYRRNASRYIARLRGMDASIRACMDTVPASDRKLVTDHDAFGYFAERYGIEVVGAIIPSQTTEAQPSAKDVSELSDLIKREGVKAIFPESSLSPKLADAIADQSGATSDYELYGDTLGPEDSGGATYIGMEKANADAMVRGFTGGAHGCNI